METLIIIWLVTNSILNLSLLFYLIHIDLRTRNYSGKNGFGIKTDTIKLKDLKEFEDGLFRVKR